MEKYKNSLIGNIKNKLSDWLELEKYVEIIPLIQKVIEHLEINTEQHDIRLNIETKDLMILGDRLNFEQAFSNLLSNAIKYSPEGGRVSVLINAAVILLGCLIPHPGYRWKAYRPCYIRRNRPWISHS